MSEADYIAVLDTGSTDGSDKLLSSLGAHVVREEINPWRFDVARNRSLSLVPENADICVCTDLDEVFKPGWRKKLEEAWQPDTAQARYRYTWSFNPDGSEGVVFWQEKIHRRKGFKWILPVHEVLQRQADSVAEGIVWAEGVQLDHYPDKNKSRAQYLPLLELALAENPDNDRVAHYLGREYMFSGRWQECIKTLKHHLAMPGSVWVEERAASMRFIARALIAMGREDEAYAWLLSAIAQAPHLREAYIELALMLYKMQDWHGVLHFSHCALKIKERPMSYICEAEAWGSLPHDLRSIAFYRLGKYTEAADECEKAILLSPKDQRLKDNLLLFQTAK